ncbi:MAG: hypothetical protein F6J86_33910 [Symploca sp. SIO1B1]|nr:hypothetical protein [Symploca sp. SIO1B1]
MREWEELRELRELGKSDKSKNWYNLILESSLNPTPFSLVRCGASSRKIKWYTTDNIRT